MNRFLVLFLLVCMHGMSTAHAQQVIQVSAKEIQQHIDHKAFPAYPQSAKAAHVQGTVVFDMRIGVTGKLESMTVVSGPPMLQQAATDCLKQWTFHPFEKDGVAVAAEGKYSLIFLLGDGSGSMSKPAGQANPPSQGAQATSSQTITVNVKSETPVQVADPKLEQQFHEPDGACKDGVLSKTFNDATVSSCQQAAVLAEQLPTEGNYTAKRSAFVYAATAYGDVGKFKEALPWATKAVNIVKLGHDSNSGTEAAYATRGEVEMLLGDYSAADQDLSVAEEILRRAVAQEGKETAQSQNPYLVRTLVRDLTLHARVLQELSRPDDAKKKRDEAEPLK
jgi:TonB family protein